MFKGGAVVERSFDLQEDEELGDLDNQVEAVVERLRSKGHTPYFRTICRGRLTVVQVAIPSLERFHLVSLGIPVAPGGRGRTFMASNQRESDLRRAGL